MIEEVFCESDEHACILKKNTFLFILEGANGFGTGS
jgi:hypothetical protein